MDHEVQNFQEDVIETSRKLPVLVDFWAAWCGPCRVLGPVLEKLEDEQEGRWKLAKVDTDRNQDLSMQYGIRGIPAVKLFVDGEVVNEFTGAMPEHAVRKWLDDALPSETKNRLDEARRLMESGDDSAAESVLESVLAAEPDHPVACGLLAGLLAFRDAERAASLADKASSDPAFSQIGEAIREIARMSALHEEPGGLPNETGAPEYLQAAASLASGDLEGAIEGIIEVLKLNRYLDDDGARKAGIAVFTLLGDTHPLTKKFRRTFDMWLY